MVDRGNEFLAQFKTIIRANHSIKVKPIYSRNPQAYSILERVHQTIDRIIHIFKVQGMVLDDENPRDGILVSTMFALCAKLYTTMKIIRA